MAEEDLTPRPGFLGAAEQVASIQRLYQEHPKALRVVDPVKGDGGRCIQPIRKSFVTQ